MVCVTLPLRSALPGADPGTKVQVQVDYWGSDPRNYQEGVGQ